MSYAPVFGIRALTLAELQELCHSRLPKGLLLATPKGYCGLLRAAPKGYCGLPQRAIAGCAKGFCGLQKWPRGVGTWGVLSVTSGQMVFLLTPARLKERSGSSSRLGLPSLGYLAKEVPLLVWVLFGPQFVTHI